MIRTRQEILQEIQDHKDTIERVEDDLGLWRTFDRKADIAECERILTEERAWLRECQEELWGNSLGTGNEPDFSANSEPTNHKEQRA